MRKFFCLIMFSALGAGCSVAPPSAEKLIESSVYSISESETIETVIAIAQCQSPDGKYTTEVHSDKDDYTYFRQRYTYRNQPFEAVVVKADSAFEIRSDSLLSLSPETIQVLKGHEFHEILAEPAKRFHSLKEPESVIQYDKPFYRVAALDNLNMPVELFFNALEGTLDFLTFQNADNRDELIRVEYYDRRKIQDFILPMHVEIIQGDKRFRFDYTEIKINDRNFRRWSKN